MAETATTSAQSPVSEATTRAGKPTPAKTPTTTWLEIEDDTSHAAYGALYIVGWIMVGPAIVLNLWQVVTTCVAWGVRIVRSTQYQQMGLPGMFGSAIAIVIIVLIIAVPAQLGLVNIVFQVKGSFIKHAQGVSVGESIKHTAVEIINQPIITILWVGIALLVDTVGDITFIALYTKDPLAMIVYMCLLYAGTTVMLRSGLKKLFAASVARDKHKFWLKAMSGGTSPGKN